MGERLGLIACGLAMLLNVKPLADKFYGASVMETTGRIPNDGRAGRRDSGPVEKPHGLGDRR
jgi:hypothetical protein